MDVELERLPRTFGMNCLVVMKSGPLPRRG